jgi:hypothetical protein
LCEQIPKIVTVVDLRESASFDVIFLDGSIISTSLRPEDYRGAEALNVYGKDHFCIVL